jgi:hypothetical protein
MNLPAASVDDEPVLKGYRRKGHARRRHLLPVCLKSLDMCPEGCALGLVPDCFQPGPKARYLEG